MNQKDMTQIMAKAEVLNGVAMEILGKVNSQKEE